MDDHIIATIESEILGLLEQITQSHGIPREWSRISPSTVAVTLAVQAIIHEHALLGSHCTLRDVYYTLAPKVAITQATTNKVLQDMAIRWGVPRLALRVHATTRGFAGGRMTLRGVDCTSTVVSIPGDFVPSDITKVEPGTRYVVCVEKDSIFQRLCKETPTLWKRVPCVVLTGCGFPDHATRAVLRTLVNEHALEPLGLVDHNPAGVRILTTYRGQTAKGSDLTSFVPMRWLGLHGSDMESLGMALPRVPLTKRDETLKDGLLKDARVPETWIEEIQRMKSKAELQSLYSTGSGLRGLVEYVERQILQNRAL